MSKKESSSYAMSTSSSSLQLSNNDFQEGDNGYASDTPLDYNMPRFIEKKISHRAAYTFTVSAKGSCGREFDGIIDLSSDGQEVIQLREMKGIRLGDDLESMKGYMEQAFLNKLVAFKELSEIMKDKKIGNSLKIRIQDDNGKTKLLEPHDPTFIFIKKVIDDTISKKKQSFLKFRFPFSKERHRKSLGENFIQLQKKYADEINKYMPNTQFLFCLGREDADENLYRVKVDQAYHSAVSSTSSESSHRLAGEKKRSLNEMKSSDNPSEGSDINGNDLSPPQKKPRTISSTQTSGTVNGDDNPLQTSKDMDEKSEEAKSEDHDAIMAVESEEDFEKFLTFLKKDIEGDKDLLMIYNFAVELYRETLKNLKNDINRSDPGSLKCYDKIAIAKGWLVVESILAEHKERTARNDKGKGKGKGKKVDLNDPLKSQNGALTHIIQFLASMSGEGGWSKNDNFKTHKQAFLDIIAGKQNTLSIGQTKEKEERKEKGKEEQKGKGKGKKKRKGKRKEKVPTFDPQKPDDLTKAVTFCVLNRPHSWKNVYSSSNTDVRNNIFLLAKDGQKPRLYFDVRSNMIMDYFKQQKEDKITEEEISVQQGQKEKYSGALSDLVSQTHESQVLSAAASQDDSTQAISTAANPYSTFAATAHQQAASESRTIDRPASPVLGS